VTGGAGYLGSALVPALLASGREVVVVDPLLYGQPEPVWLDQPAATFLKRGIETLDVEDFAGVDEVIDFAAISNEWIAERIPSVTWATNGTGRCRVAELSARAGVIRYFLASSSNVYGARDEPFAETDPIDPVTVYSKANAAAERGVLALASDRFHPLVLRQATVYGSAPVMRYDLVINAMVADAVRTGRCNVMGDGSQVRPFVWVADLVQAYLAILRRPAEELGGRIVNLGSSADQFAVNEIPEMLSELIDEPIEHSYYGDLDRLSHRLDCGRLEAILARGLGPSLASGASELLHRINEDPGHVEVSREQRGGFLDRYNAHLIGHSDDSSASASDTGRDTAAANRGQ
jgi:nucleoside-diphosphate-sugar epimerase